MSRLMHLLVRAFLPLAARHDLIESHGAQGLRVSSTVPPKGTSRAARPRCDHCADALAGASHPPLPEGSP